MLIATFLEDIIGLLLKFPRFSSGRLAYAHAEWQAQSTLQLHRLAHENLGLVTWTRTDEAIPVTQRGDTLAVLDVMDSKHARMAAPSEELERLNAPQKTAGVEEMELEQVESPKQQPSVRARAKYERVPSSA